MPFSWGDTRKTAGEKDKGHGATEGEFDSTQITMKRWRDFEKERRLRNSTWQPNAPGMTGHSQYETYSDY